ncbi:MAG: XdhC family protein [Eggerthellaceae bacterium]|jgi:xanthine dehydrogenase accessory factor|nr:XdhC family protein [Eggerthellaceae bacterium]MCH4221473.1 XdhC family protein [Eggerthellaceae bacterium]
MDTILEQLCNQISQGRTCALISISKSQGSSPRDTGAVMMVKSNGTTVGTIGGGGLEAHAISVARDVISTRQARTITIRMDGTQPDLDLICGGTVELLIMPLDRREYDVMQMLLNALHERKDVMYCAIFYKQRVDHVCIDCSQQHACASTTDERDLIRHLIDYSLGHEDEQPLQGANYHTERLPHDGMLYFLGGGHVAYATEQVARVAGFTCTVLDDRPEYASKERFPFSSCSCVPEYDDLNSIVIAPNDYIVIMTRGHLYDFKCLTWALATPALYIGMMSSRRKRKIVYEKIQALGYSGIRLEHVHTPIGLPLGGKSPGEIGVSIIAQLITHRAQRRMHTSTLHDRVGIEQTNQANLGTLSCFS